jgi:hypothetical protein
MKAQLLKIAGVKTEKEFYSKYPTEAAFKKAHGKEFKKAQLGVALNIPTAQGGWVDKAANAEFSCAAHPRSELRQATNATNGGSGDVTRDVKNAYWDKVSGDFQGRGWDKPAFNQAYEDSMRVGPQFDRMEYSKHFDPTTGKILKDPTTSPSDYSNILKWYNQVPGFQFGQRPTIPQILETQASQPGGLKSYKKLAKADFPYETPPANVKKNAKGGKIAKAAIGDFIGGQTINTSQLGFKNYLDSADYNLTGMTDDMRKEEAYKQAQLKASQHSSKNSTDLTNLAKGLFGGGDTSGSGDASGAAEAISSLGARNGKKVKKAQVGQRINPNIGTISAESLATPKAGLDQMTTDTTNPFTKNKFDFAQGIPLVGNIIKGIKGIQDEKKQMLKEKQFSVLSGVTAQAAGLPTEYQRHIYDRPEDYMMQGSNPYGNSYNPLSAQFGAQVGGNPSEIQNTYSPNNTLYSDLGYEPLSDSDIVKQYRTGGLIPRAQGGGSFLKGIDKFGDAGGMDMLSQGVSAIGGQNAGGDLGGDIGGAIGSAIPIPGGKYIGQAVGTIAGRLLDKNPGKIKKYHQEGMQNMYNTAGMNFGKSIQQANNSYMEEGGYVSNNWNPQVITKFGDMDVSDVHTFASDGMQSLRTGGHIRQNQLAMGGELNTHWGGYAEPISQNPYLPNGGQTVMFRGQSHSESDGHGRTGIGVSYGAKDQDSYTDYAEYGTEANADVEVQRGEPAVQTTDQTGKPALTVFGARTVNKEAAAYAGVEPGKKYQNIGKQIAENDTKINKKINKTSELVDSHEVKSPFDKLSMNSHRAMLTGLTAQQKANADKTTKLAEFQNNTDELAKAMGLDINEFDKGKFKMAKKDNTAKFGKKIPTAQGGRKFKYNWTGASDNQAIKTEEELKSSGPGGFSLTDAMINENLRSGIMTDVTAKTPSFLNVSTIDPTWSPITDIRGNSPAKGLFPNYQVVGDNGQTHQSNPGGVNQSDKLYESQPNHQPSFLNTGVDNVSTGSITDNAALTNDKKKKFGIKDLMGVYNQVLPYIRPSDKTTLDPSQLYPEMLASSMNQQEPVAGIQSYQPILEENPSPISLQDQLNEVEKQSRAAQRQISDPAALAGLYANTYEAKNKVLAEQFRMNQQLPASVRAHNIQLLNAAKEQNLAMYERQAQKQAMAKSTTKQQALEIAKSIAAKKAQHDLENKTLQVYENMYNYRFGKDYVADNWNPLFQPNIPTVSTTTAGKSTELPEGYEYIYNKSGQPIDVRKAPKKSQLGTKLISRNGSIVKALKNI